MRPKHILVGATAVATALLVAAPATAGQPAGPSAETIAEGLSGALQVKAYPGGAMVSQSPTDSQPGRVTAIDDNGDQFDVVRDPGVVTGFDYSNAGLAYTSIAGTEEAPVTRLKILRSINEARLASGARRGLLGQEGENLANLGRFEKRVNPDGDQTYGIKGLGSCDVPRRFRPYSGIQESNPYAVEAAQDGGWFVADAAANAIVHVSDSGDVRLVKVLPVQRLEITRAIAGQFDLPRCTIGKTWRYEPVPTDVEEGAAGRLYMTLLPGEPAEGGGGKVLRFNPNTGKTVTLARGLIGATNLSLANNRIFVTELFGNKISVVNATTKAKSRYLAQNQPASVDYFGGALYATTDIFGPAKLVKITEGQVN